MPDVETLSESGSSTLMSAKELFVSALKALNSEIASEDISRAELDDIDALLWSAIASIATKRSVKSSIMNAMNTLCRVNRLPPELLRMVFRQSIRLTTLPTFTRKGKTQSCGWTHTHMQVSDVLDLSRVCRQWRQVILLSPHMWTSIRDVRVAETKMFLERAQNLPLQVTISRAPSWFLDICANRGALIRELHWDSPFCTVGAAPFVLDISAPNVERLSLSKGLAGASYSNMVILRGATQNVKMLSMSDLGWFPSNQFPALTHLVISDGRLHPDDFRSFLSRCPNLTVLVIRFPLPPGTSAVPAQLPTTPPVRHLRKVSLHMRLVDLLPILPIDRACTIIELTKDVFNIPRGFVNRLLAHPDYKRQPLFRLYISHSSETESNAWNSLMLTNGAGGICFKSTSSLSIQTAALFARYGGLDHVTELWIDGVDMIMFRLCTAIRPGLLNLRTLSVLRADHANSTSALSMLVQYVRTETKGTTGILLAPPALRLVLADVTDLDARKATRDMLAILGAADAPLLWEKKDRRLILRAPQFSPEHYTAVVPRLLTRWESVETEVSSGGDDALPVVRAEDEFTAWEKD